MIFKKKQIGEGVNLSPNKRKAGAFDKSYSVTPLLFTMVVVPDGQASAIEAIMVKEGIDSAFTVVSHGKGTASSDFYDVLGIGELRKQVLVSFIKEASWDKLKQELSKRFSVSRYSKGIGFTIGLSSLSGVSAYMMLSNCRNLEETSMIKEKTNMEQLKPTHEAVIAIVNDGYADLVMGAAKKAGARGGTIINGRGTGNKDIEKFFGIAITPEKEIAIILVPKDIKEDVMISIGKECGINTKGQGIVFSLPVNDVVGLVEDEKGEGKSIEYAE